MINERFLKFHVFFQIHISLTFQKHFTNSFPVNFNHQVKHNCLKLKKEDGGYYNEKTYEHSRKYHEGIIRQLFKLFGKIVPHGYRHLDARFMLPMIHVKKSLEERLSFRSSGLFFLKIFPNSVLCDSVPAKNKV